MEPEAVKTIKMAALGRPFSLGMLYDCRQDSLIPGMTLWDPDSLKKDARERPQPNSEFEIVASESTEDKSSALNVQASLKASFLAGLVEVEGSAKYLNDCKISKNQARVTLKYKTTTKYQELSMRHLGRDNVKHPYVFDKGIATHVVKGILYGAQAFFVFDREVSEKEDHKDIEGSLKVMIQQIPGLVLQGQDSLQLTETDTANVQNFSCKFHGDFNLQRHPVSFQDAIEVYQSLPTLLGANGENAVPVKVWLMPLKILDSAAAQLVRQISIRLVMEAQSILEDLSELEMRCNDAMKNSTTQQFPQIGKKLKAFRELCSENKLEFQRTLARKLPSIRGGGEEEAVLAEMLKMRHSSPFNSKNLNVAENIRMLVTFADGQRPPVLEAINVSGVPWPKTDAGLPVHFKFNNSALFADNTSINDKSGNADSDEDMDDDNFDEMFWNMGAKSMKNFFTALDRITTKSLQMTKEVLKERKQLETAIEELQQPLKCGFVTLQQLRMINQKLKEHKEMSVRSIARLKEIALRPNPLSSPEYIDLLIEGEKSEAKEGYLARIQSLEAMRKRATIIS
ncbi:stonustoxin subunit beta-like [Myripristis murdjan]|uniref:stonustoxin subunit beta-like n=1 Tax=Myripristis murdjan TaxID=586833 RepID=UPI001176168D|nr:stonustoxin subunit beta-like [Myripristis murdjan]